MDGSKLLPSFNGQLPLVEKKKLNFKNGQIQTPPRPLFNLTTHTSGKAKTVLLKNGRLTLVFLIRANTHQMYKR